jgi:hypothetical protein
VYAEADTREHADQLANEVAAAVCLCWYIVLIELIIFPR